MVTVLDTDTTIEIPPDIAVCPYCKAKVTISPDGWTQEEDETWVCDSFNIWCESEPPIEDDGAWDGWLEMHSDMPYIRQLPVDEKILAWLKNSYRFDLK